VYGLLKHPLINCRLQEWEYAKVRQDAQLERIERGVGTLGDMAKGMQVRCAETKTPQLPTTVEPLTV
jgi:hypothetical protein